MPPPRLGAVWAIAPLGRDHLASRRDDALSERVPLLGAIVQVAVGKWSGAPRSPRDLDQRCARLSTSPRPRHCPQPSEAEHGEEMAEQRVAADGHSVAPRRSLRARSRTPSFGCLAACSCCIPAPRTPERAQVARAAARAPLVPLGSETIIERGDVLACHHEDVACRSLLCPMHGVQLRARGQEARRAD